MKKIILCFLISVIVTNILKAQDDVLVIKHPQGDHLQGTVNVKILPKFRDYFQTLNNTLPGFEELGITSIHKKFPNRKPPVNEYHLNGKKLPDLSLIYELEYTTVKDAFKVSNDLMVSGYFQYAVPQLVSYPLYNPDDSLLPTHNPYHFNTMALYDAWDITQGDSTIVIGYTDTSFDLGHEDLTENIKHNYADPIGVIDDGDGYTDNFSGWDMVDNDNDVYIANEIHGTSVAAVGSATGDNNKGYLGSGFKCMFLPVKVANSSQVITKGYEGIVYCVDHGAKIINCSWGNTSGFNQLAQDIIDDAVLNNDVVIVASAGNVDAENYYYPASYEYVLSVTGVDAGDLIDPAGPSVNPTPFTRNDSVDVSAPGFSVYSTARVGGLYYYQPTGGTSIAAPLVAGVAGLVRTQFPNLSALEVIERIKCTADNIDAVPGNEIYAGKIGTGRVNAYAALTSTLCGPVGLNETESNNNILIYPNPANDVLNVLVQSTVNGQQSTVEIYNSVGEIVYFSNLQSPISNLDISSLSAGIYYCAVKTDKTTFSKKMVVVK